MGWTETQFYATSPRYFFHAWRTYARKLEAEAKERENWQRWNLELNRRAAMYLLNVQLDQKDRIGEADFFPLPWDEKPEPPKPEDAARAAADFIKEKGYDQGIPIDEFFN